MSDWSSGVTRVEAGKDGRPGRSLRKGLERRLLQAIIWNDSRTSVQVLQYLFPEKFRNTKTFVQDVIMTLNSLPKTIRTIHQDYNINTIDHRQFNLL